MKKAILFILTMVTMVISAIAQIPTASLVAHYDFSNGALTDNINSANFTKTGTASTNITDRFGNANGAISLNGDDLTRPDIDFHLIGGNGPFLSQTISFWIKTATNDANTRIIYNDNDQTTVVDAAFTGLSVYLQNGQINAALRDDQFHGNYITHTTNVSDNTWHHVTVEAVVTYISPTSRIVTHVYVDAIKEGGTTLVSSTMPGYSPNHGGNISFSRLKGGSVATEDKYEDGLDEVLFYTRLLSDAEVNSITTYGGCIVNIPDANFKNYLVRNTAINTNGDTEIQCSEASAFTGSILANNKGISDFTGIEAFTSLTGLFCAGNSLTSLNISNNTALISLICGYNSLTSLDISTHTALTSLTCQDNSLTSLNAGNGNNTNFTDFKTSNNPNLTCVEVDDVTYSATNWTNIDVTTSFSTNCVAPCTVNIPDPNFKAFLVANSAINSNGDTEIQCSEASTFSGTMDCSNQSISSLTGIEAFTSLDTLKCWTNSISTLDLSSNIALTFLGCGYNSLSSLNVTQNPLLTLLSCPNNPLTSLDVTQNTALTTLSCGFTTLNSLDVTKNTALTELNLPGNPLTSIDVSQNTALTTLKVYSGSLTSIDVSQNTALTTLWVQENSLTTLDITQNMALENLSCRNNSLTSLDVSQHSALAALWCSNNSLTTLNVANGNNTNFTNFVADNNQNLTCIEVDDVAYSTANWTNIDTTADYSTNCNASPCTVTIPDAYFKAFLVSDPTINTNRDTEIQCSEAAAYSGPITIYKKSITDLTGIEAFVNLTHLNCTKNFISSIDISNNTALLTLYVNDNLLTNIDVSNNLLLEDFQCTDNSLTSIDITTNTALTSFVCSDNLITALNVTENTALTDLHCQNNSLTTLDVSSNVVLTYLSCYGNEITSLDVSKNIDLETIFCYNNALISLNMANGNNSNVINFYADNNPNLTCIQVDDVAYSTTNWANRDLASFFNTDCSTSVGINEVALQKINIYPNPVKKQLFIASDHLEVTGISIIDHTGTIVKSIDTNVTKSIDISDLTQGIYVLKVSTKSGVSANLFQKQ